MSYVGEFRGKQISVSRSKMASKFAVAVMILVSSLCISTASAHHDSEMMKYSIGQEKADAKSQARDSNLRFYVKPPREMTMTASENGVLECQAGGTPPPAIHWLKDGTVASKTGAGTEDDAEDLEEDDSDSVLGISSTNARLHLDCVKPEDSGTYVCVAENLYHRISTSVHLTVNPSSRLATATCRRKNLSKIPRITMWSRKRLEYMGGDARLFCRALGRPTADIQWLDVRGDAIKDNQKYKLLPNGDLLIRQLKWSDMGNYACIAKNAEGSDRVETFLYPTKPGN